eukprot:1731239-Prymnesium_polylepis.1
MIRVSRQPPQLLKTPIIRFKPPQGGSARSPSLGGNHTCPSIRPAPQTNLPTQSGTGPFGALGVRFAAPKLAFNKSQRSRRAARDRRASASWVAFRFSLVGHQAFQFHLRIMNAQYGTSMVSTVQSPINAVQKVMHDKLFVPVKPSTLRHKLVDTKAV